MHNLIADETMKEIKEDLAEKLKKNVETYDGFMDGDSYIYHSGVLEEFNRSQLFFHRKPL